MSEIILSTEVYHTDGTIHPFGVDSVPTLEKAVAAMSSGFGMKMITGTVMTARDGSETGELLLVGSVANVRPLRTSVFGHDFVVLDGKLYDRNNFSSCPRKLGVPARDRGDRTWISYLSPKFDENPSALAKDYINSAFFDGDNLAWDWNNRAHTVVQKALRPVIDVAVSVIREAANRPARSSQLHSIIEELISMCNALADLEDGKISKIEYHLMYSSDALSRMENITKNSGYLLSSNYELIKKWADLGMMLRSCFVGCNNDSHHFSGAINLASQMSSKAHMASELRRSVGLADMVYTVILGKALSRPE